MRSHRRPTNHHSNRPFSSLTRSRVTRTTTRSNTISPVHITAPRRSFIPRNNSSNTNTISTATSTKKAPVKKVTYTDAPSLFGGSSRNSSRNVEPLQSQQQPPPPPSPKTSRPEIRKFINTTSQLNNNNNNDNTTNNDIDNAIMRQQRQRVVDYKGLHMMNDLQYHVGRTCDNTQAIRVKCNQEVMVLFPNLQRHIVQGVDAESSKRHKARHDGYFVAPRSGLYLIRLDTVITNTTSLKNNKTASSPKTASPQFQVTQAVASRLTQSCIWQNSQLFVCDGAQSASPHSSSAVVFLEQGTEWYPTVCIHNLVDNAPKYMLVSGALEITLLKSFNMQTPVV